MLDLPIAERWFVAEAAGDGVTRLWESHVDEFLESNVWHVRGLDADLVVDTANGIGRLRPEIEALADDRPVIAVATHGHFDHVGGLQEFDDRRVHEDDAEMTRSPFPLRMRRRDFPPETDEMFGYYGFPTPDLIIKSLPDSGFNVDGWVAPGAEPTVLLHEGDVIDLGDRSLQVMHTPGHTAGSACLWDAGSRILFTGDALYADSRLEFEDPPAAARSLERIGDLPVRIAHTGHGRSVVGDELRELAAAAIAGVSAGDYDA